MTSTAQDVVRASLNATTRLLGLGDPEGTAAAKRLLSVLQEADAALGARLVTAARTTGGLPSRFSGAAAAMYRAQIGRVAELVQRRLAGETNAQAAHAMQAGFASTVGLVEQLEAAFTGIPRVLRVREAAVLAGMRDATERSLLGQRATSVDRYGRAMIGEFERTMAVGMVGGLSQWEMINALTAHGGPAGPGVSMAATVVNGQVVRTRVENIPEGLFRRYRYWAERIVRTEAAHAYNAGRLSSMHAIRDTDFPDLQKKILAHFDDRTAEDSVVAHGQVRDLDGFFRDGAGRVYQRPPARPNDRETVIPWRPHWPDVPSTAQLDATQQVQAIERLGTRNPRPPMREADVAYEQRATRMLRRDARRLAEATAVTKGLTALVQVANEGAQLAASKATASAKTAAATTARKAKAAAKRAAALAAKQAAQTATAAAKQAAKLAKQQGAAELRAKKLAEKKAAREAVLAQKLAAKKAKQEAAATAKLAKQKAAEAAKRAKAEVKAAKKATAAIPAASKQLTALKTEAQVTALVDQLSGEELAAAVAAASGDVSVDASLIRYIAGNAAAQRAALIEHLVGKLPKAPVGPAYTLTTSSGYVDVFLGGEKVAYFKALGPAQFQVQPPADLGMGPQTFATPEEAIPYAVQVSNAIKAKKAAAAAVAEEQAAQLHVEEAARRQRALEGRQGRINRALAFGRVRREAVDFDADPVQTLRRSTTFASRAGQSVPFDGGAVENFDVQFRVEVEPNGRRVTRVRCKLTDQAMGRAEARLREAGADRSDVMYRRSDLADVARTGPLHFESGASSTSTGIGVRDADGTTTTLVTAQGAVRNFVEIEIDGDDPRRAVEIARRVFRERLGVENTDPPTHRQRETAVRARLITLFDRAGTEELRETERHPEQVDAVWKKALRRHPELREIADDVEWREETGGKIVPYSRALAERLIRSGVTHLQHDGSSSRLVRMMSDPDGAFLLSSTERYRRGLIIDGASTSADFGTGGADGVFTRAETFDPDDVPKKYGRDFRAVINADELGRLDWWAFNTDNYGAVDRGRHGETAETMRRRRSRVPDMESTAAGESFDSGNEVMLQNAVAARSVVRIEVGADVREQILTELRAAGITEFAGRPIENVLVVAPRG